MSLKDHFGLQGGGGSGGQNMDDVQFLNSPLCYLIY